MAELGDTADHRRALYELNRTCSADIPERGEFHTYGEYVAERIEVPSFTPAGVVLAAFHHPRNGSASATNRRLGFVDDDADRDAAAAGG